MYTLRRHVRRKVHPRSLDPLHLLAIRRRVVERGEAPHHLEDDDAEAPPVHRLAMARLVHHLGRHVVQSAARGVRLAVGELLRKAQVRQPDEAGLVQEHVLELEVAVDDVARVEVLERVHHARREERRTALRDAALRGRAVLLHVVEHLGTEHGVHEEVDVLRVLRGVVHARHEVGPDGEPDVALAVHVLHQLLLDDVRLVEHLHGVEHRVVPHQQHLRVPALSQDDQPPNLVQVCDHHAGGRGGGAGAREVLRVRGKLLLRDGVELGLPHRHAARLLRALQQLGQVLDQAALFDGVQQLGALVHDVDGALLHDVDEGALLLGAQLREHRARDELPLLDGHRQGGDPLLAEALQLLHRPQERLPAAKDEGLHADPDVAERLLGDGHDNGALGGRGHRPLRRV
mmetsp:Transcript_27894/g.61014  ORF Transcript_27894/g.61014 Transcript_27894/m.61014 type:complete len:402 (-) Transcript_27894:3301-4506(-)